MKHMTVYDVMSCTVYEFCSIRVLSALSLDLAPELCERILMG